MLKKKVEVIFFTLLIFSVIVVIVIESLSITFVGRSIEYINDYNKFYLFKKKYIPMLVIDFGDGGVGSGYKVWILPNQKRKLLAKIKEDVEEILKDVVEKNGDMLKSYKLNDDFKKIYLYYYKDVDNFKVNPELAERYNIISKKQMFKILLKMELYYEFSRGDGKSAYPHDTSIDIIPVELR
ncbi:MAG: hypothetical protein AB9835_09230 [Eubacteriales bacterium]